MPESSDYAINGPADLVAAARSLNFDFRTTRDEFSGNELTWRLYLDLMELDGEKLSTLIEKHGESEDATKYALRKKLATAINLIPMVISVVSQYLFAEPPTLDAKGDKAIETFLSDCDGAGTSFRDYIRNQALPLAMGLGWVDTFVELTEGEPAPRLFTVTPLERTNWSCRPNHSYDAIVFKAATPDRSIFDTAGIDTRDAFVALIAAGQLPNIANAKPPAASTTNATWIRSNLSGDRIESIGTCPTARVPIATLYYRQSVDPQRRHWGVSKIAMMAVLTKAIIQILSWTHEDILANLALFTIPTKGGRKPKDEAGNNPLDSLTSFTAVYYDGEASHAPGVLQGEVSHIKMKLQLVEVYAQEILRLAHLISAEGRASNDSEGNSSGATVTSGFHAVVNRMELFRELQDLSGRLDAYALDMFALVKSWASGTDVTKEQMLADTDNAPRASFQKKFELAPLEQLIKEADEIRKLFRSSSPTLLRVMLLKVAGAAMYQDDPLLDDVRKEIETGADDIARRESPEDLLNAGGANGNGRITIPASESNGE